MTMFKVGDIVRKTSGDYIFYGRVAAIFYKLTNDQALRFVVENSDGVLMIMNEKQLEPYSFLQGESANDGQNKPTAG